MVHYDTRIQSLTAEVRNLQYKNQELQRSYQELSQAVAGAAGISQSYGDRMTQTLSTGADQGALVRDHRWGSRDIAASVEDHLQMSNHNRANCFSAAETLGQHYATIASGLDELHRWYTAGTDPAVVVPPPPLTIPTFLQSHFVARRSLLPRRAWAHHPWSQVALVPFLFPTILQSVASTIRPLVWTRLGGGGGGCIDRNASY